MSPFDPAEQLAREVYQLDREACIRELTHFRAIPLDFNESYLQSMSVERLRHVLLAALITVRNRAASRHN